MEWSNFIPHGLYEKFVTRNNGNNQLEVEDSVDEIFQGVSDRNMWKVAEKLREIKKDRENQMRDYMDMLDDSIIQSGIELMADDATQTDMEKEKTVWIESEDNKSLTEDLNEWLHETVEIEDSIWTYAFDIVHTGEAFLKTFYSDERFQEDHEIGDYFELKKDSLNFNELMQYGDTVGYYVDDEKRIYPPEDFIHFVSDRGYKREEIEVERDEGKDSGEEPEIETYVTRYGTSIVDAVRSAYKTLKIMEDVMLMSRIVRSAMYRIFQIEVGSSSRKKTLKIIQEVKNSIENRESFNELSDLYESERSPLPVNSNVYSPKRNGNGDIQVNEVGGNVDVKNIVDIEYFRNKLFAALKIPKAFLGFSEEMPGNIGGGTSLTKLDIRYARTVKKVQSVLKQGVRDMCNFYLQVNDKKDKINKFKVRMTKISSSEDTERNEELDSRVRTADSINGLVGRDFENMIEKREFLLWLIEEVIGLSGMSKVVKEETDIEDEDNEDQQQNRGFM